MRKLLSNHNRRHLEFLELLITQSFISLQRASAALGYPVRTLSADITQINTYLAPMQIVTNINGVSLSIPGNSSIREIYALILHQSREMLFLRHLFFHPGQTQEEFAAALYISVSTFRRMIGTMKKNLALYQIKLKTAPYRLIGDEKHISQLYVALFSEWHLDNLGPMTVEEHSILAELNKKIADEHGYFLTFPDLKQIILWTYVRLMRMMKGHYISCPLNDNTPIGSSVLKDVDFCQRFQTAFGVKLNSDTLFELYHLFIRSKYVKNFNDITAVTKASSYHQQLNTSILTLLYSIADMLGIAAADTEQLHLDLFNNIQFTERPPYILYNRNKIFTEGFRREHPLIADAIRQRITQSFTLNFNDNHINEITYYIVSHWPGLIRKINERVPLIKVGIFFDSDVEHAQMIADLIQHNTSIQIQMSVIHFYKIDFKDFFFPETDILITNIPKLETNCRYTICIDDYPTVHNWKAIYFSIEKIYQELLQTLENRPFDIHD